MPTLRIVQIDAFSETAFGGNPAAVMPLDTWLDDDMLQAIAEENNLSETAFYLPTKGDAEADYELRWFTPTAEVAMCGHATLTTGHLLLSEHPDTDTVRFRTRKAGVLEVRRADDGYELDLPITPVEPAERPDLLDALGTPDGEVFLSIVDSAEDTAIIQLSDEEAVRTCRPDFKALANIHLMAIVTARGNDTNIVSRVFVPAWGIDEDPVTGSAHAALTPFWADRLDCESFSAFQASARGGRLGCRLAGDRAVLSGRCATVIEGEFFF
ncbi:PhzF family phenazine biosynthesis protein [Parasphingopyxis algicola]|uniref:PhzF family phenazine biosynthesis protein n=1 Tax=Parasphingopyxis algicola TaxID=2026624 RepID=UPI0015A3BDBE|nr:PhzF family phenazine biosynthesis protein [Parasphingopyxis algicola]QLC25006.1 PhzF family phenazine biosynthesis protein [Parasphingopyxis algicola]